MALDSELGVRRPRAVDTSCAICARLLAWTTCRTRLVVLAHDIRRHAVLTHTDRGICRSGAPNTLHSIVARSGPSRACSARGPLRVDDIRLRALLALTRDAVLSARARLARGAVCVRTLASLAGDAARSVWPDNVITVLTFDTKLRVCRAITVGACSSICVGLLAWTTNNASYLVRTSYFSNAGAFCAVSTQTN